MPPRHAAIAGSRSSPGGTAPRRFPTARLLTVFAAVLALLAGCAQAGQTVRPAAKAADGSLKVRFMSTSPTFTDLPTAVILARGHFKRVGLDVSYRPGPSSAPLITQAVMAGDADVGSSGAGAMYSAYAEGMTSLVSLGTSNRSVTFGLALNQKTVDKLAKKGVTPDSPARERVRALRGLRLMASPPGSTGNALVRLMLNTYGVDPDDDVTIMPNNDAASQLATTREGRADGFAQSFPRTSVPKVEGWGAQWLNWAKDLPQMLPLSSHDYYTTRGWLKANPEAAKRFMRALWLAHRDLQHPNAELRDAVYKLPGFVDMDKKAFDDGWELAVAAYKGANPLTTREMFEKEASVVNRERLTPMHIDYEDVYDLG
ncbi:ABC transporter substrate-binding protein, partial [Streptomyces sp. NPDC056983]|uniref:ABC transporter substrate-binding protein n=1 Tax=Streptomyces sp. NPDC056983 TaxID=3345987 RepID=UPI0036400367